MDNINKPITIQEELQNKYWEYILSRSNEYFKNKLTGRLIIDFQKGEINSLQDQQIIAGVSALNFGIDRII